MDKRILLVYPFY